MINSPYHGKPPYPTSAYEQKALDKIHFLWKLDDPEWVAQREKDWDFLLNHCVYNEHTIFEQKLYEGYFKYGKLEGYDPNHPTGTYIPWISQLIFTPYNSPETAKLVFESELIKSHGQEEVLSGYIYIYSSAKKHDNATGLRAIPAILLKAC